MRGTVPDQIDEDLARAVGVGVRAVTDATSSGVVVGHDMRPSSPGMARAFAEGAAAAGADVTMIGLASTDQLYFASGGLGLPGAMFTASHNPAQYNGIKMCRAERRAARAWTPGCPPSATWSRRGSRPPPSGPAPSSSATCSRTTPSTCSTWRR